MLWQEQSATLARRDATGARCGQPAASSLRKTVVNLPSCPHPCRTHQQAALWDSADSADWMLGRLELAAAPAAAKPVADASAGDLPLAHEVVSRLRAWQPAPSRFKRDALMMALPRAQSTH